MKYGKLNLGQIEALVNKLGGEWVVRAILADSHKIVPQGVEDIEKIAFLQSYEKCFAVRNMLRAWDCYGSEDGVSNFRMAASNVADRAGNLAEQAINENSQFNEQFKGEIIENIDLALCKLVEFKVRDGEGFEFAQGCLEEIKQRLLKGDKLGVFKYACSLRSFLRGVETLNDLILTRVDNVHRPEDKDRK